MFEVSEIAGSIRALFPAVEIKKALEGMRGETEYSRYAGDPVGFGEEVLGESYTEDIKVMMESVRDYPVTIAKSANATGKTHGAARVGVWFMKCFRDSQVYTAAAPPEENLKKLLWGEIGGLVFRHEGLFRGCKQNVLHIESGPRSFLTGVSIPLTGDASVREAKFSGKHAPHLLFIVDEGDAVPDEVYKGIESCMSGGHFRLLVMFNPRSEVGPVYRMERDGLANVVSLSAFNHPNVVSGEGLIPGAVDRETTVRRVNQWCRKLVEGEAVDEGCFELPKFLEGCEARDQRGRVYAPLRGGYYRVDNPAFSYMVMGKYPAQGTNQLISKEWTTAARVRWDLYIERFGEVPPQGSVGVMGVDPGELGDDMTQNCFRYGGWVDKFKGWGGVDVLVTGDRASEEYHKRDIGIAYVDANGVGAGVAPHMRRLHCNAVDVKVQERATDTTEMGEFGILRDQLWWACREWLRLDTTSMLPPDDELLEELHAPTYQVIKGKIKVMDKLTMKELLKRSPNKADALCMTMNTSAQARRTGINRKPVRKVMYPW